MRKNQATKQFTKQPYVEDVGPRKIESIQFSTLSGTEVLKLAEVQVSQAKYYEPSRKPSDGGLLDPHMGPPNKTGKCETCGGEFLNCPGHYGYLNLALPVFNAGYLSTIVDIMKCICKKCSIILLEEKERQDFLKKMRNPKIEPLQKSEILKKVVKKCNAMTGTRRAVKCSRCGYINVAVLKKTVVGDAPQQDSAAKRPWGAASLLSHEA